jgi:hypothetical protein
MRMAKTTTRRLMGIACATTVLVAVLLGGIGVAQADQPAGAQGGAPGAQATKDEDALPSIEEAVGEMERIDGFYTLYRDKNKLFALIRGDQLEQEFIMATSVARGRFFFGFQWTEQLLLWRRNEQMLMLVQPDVWHRAEAGSPISEAVQRTYTETVVRTLPIKAEGPKGAVLIDLGALYLKQPDAFFGSIAKNSNAELARIHSLKNFPQNVETAVDLYTTDKSTGYASLLTVHYSLSGIPKTTYKPRLADDRIGYYLTAIKDYSGGPRDDTRFVRYINRWHLEKADPELDVSPPKRPIVFYLDKNIPVRYRRYVREGVLEWNKAFEKLGIVDAMVVRQQTENNEFANFDPEDARYNFVRWITTDVPFAYGPSRANPRTGEILDADILFDDSFIRTIVTRYDEMIEHGLVADLPPELGKYLEEHPERHPGRFMRARREALEQRAEASMAALAGPEGVKDPYRLGGPLDPGMLGRRGSCTIGRGKAHQFALAALALTTLATETEGGDEGEENGDQADQERDERLERMIGELVKETVMHEVGHTLGLRHNFKASSWRTLADVERHGVEAGDLSASVMDYNALHIALDHERQGRYLPSTIGPWDYWVIEYGYGLIDAPTPEAEREQLKKIASRAAEPELVYGSDEDVWSSDPLTNRWDMGADPLDFAENRMLLVKKLQADLVERAVPEGESYARLRTTLGALLFEYSRVSNLAAGYVGGTYVHRDHRGDPGERDPLVSVPVDKQRQALRFVTDNVFAADALDFSPELLRKVAAGRWLHWGSVDAFEDPDYEIHDRILTVQLWALFQMTNPVTVRRIYDAELRLPPSEDTMTLPELYTALTRAIFAETLSDVRSVAVYTNRQPFIPSTRRNLQREYVGDLIDIALDHSGAYPRVARTLAWDQLRQLAESIERSLEVGGDVDDYSAAHLRECQARIEEAIDADYFLLRG